MAPSRSRSDFSPWQQTQTLNGIERVRAAFGERLDVVDLEIVCDEWGAAFLAGAVLADAHAFALRLGPLMAPDMTHFEAKAFRDLRHAFPRGTRAADSRRD